QRHPVPSIFTSWHTQLKTQCQKIVCSLTARGGLCSRFGTRYPYPTRIHMLTETAFHPSVLARLRQLAPPALPEIAPHCWSRVMVALCLVALASSRLRSPKNLILS